MSAFITHQDGHAGLFCIKERADGETLPVADFLYFDQAKSALLVYMDQGKGGLDEFLTRLEDEHIDEMQNAEVCCRICDALGHGQPGYGPCPLEERGWMDALQDEEIERRMGVIPFDEAMRMAEAGR